MLRGGLLLHPIMTLYYSVLKWVSLILWHIFGNIRAYPTITQLLSPSESHVIMVRFNNGNSHGCSNHARALRLNPTYQPTSMMTWMILLWKTGPRMWKMLGQQFSNPQTWNYAPTKKDVEENWSPKACLPFDHHGTPMSGTSAKLKSKRRKCLLCFV